MPLAFRRPTPGVALAAILSAACLVAATPAAAFKVIDSPIKGCALWANDEGQPLQTQGGGKIGRKAPCGEGRHAEEEFETLFGEAPGTLVVRDAKRQMECVVALAPGSKTVVSTKACQRWTGG